MSIFDRQRRRSPSFPAMPSALGATFLLLCSTPGFGAPAQSGTSARVRKTTVRAAKTMARLAAASTSAGGSAVPHAPGATLPSRTVTLNDVVNIAVANNSSIILAQQRLQKAQEQITQIDAQARPQVTAALTDTLSSQRGFSTAGGAITNPSLPGGGQIPVVTDQGGGNSSGFVGGGGGGTTASNGTTGVGTGTATGTGTTTGTTGTSAGSGGAFSGSGGLSTGTGTTGTGTSTGSTGFGSGTGTTGTSTSGAGTPGTNSLGNTGTGTTGTGGSTGTGGTGTDGTGTFGTTGPTATPGTGGTGSSSGGGTGASGASFRATPSALPEIAVAALPPILQAYATATTKTGVQTTAPQAARRPQDTTGPGTGAGTGNGTDAVTTQGSSGSYNNYGGRLTVSQYIDLFGLVGTARDVEKITRDFYVLDLQRIANETALSAKNLYFNVLKAQGQVDVDQEQVNFATDNVRITTDRFNAGLASQFDVLSAQTQLSNAQQQLISAQNNLDLTGQNLNNLLGVRLDQTLTLVTPPLPSLTQQFDTPQSLQSAFGNRPELKQADNNIVIAQKLLKLAGEGLQPTLGLVGTANYNGLTSSSSPHDTYNLSAELNIPLYDGGLTHSRERSAQIDLQTQQVTRATLLQSVELEVRQALINVFDAQAQASSASQGVTQAQEAVRLAQVRYQNGLGTLLDVTNAQANLATARNNLLNAQFNYQTAIAQLIRAEGGR